MKPIKDYPNYLVTEGGEIYSSRRGVILKGGYDKDGYKLVTLQDGARRRTAKVHREVAELYCHKPDGCNVVNHLDGDKANNLPTNLEWTTISGNTSHAYKLGSLNQKGERNNATKYTDKLVQEILVLHKNGYSISELSLLFGIKTTTLYSWVSGARRSQSSETIPEGSTPQAIGGGSGAASRDV